MTKPLSKTTVHAYEQVFGIPVETRNGFVAFMESLLRDYNETGQQHRKIEFAKYFTTRGDIAPENFDEIVKRHVLCEVRASVVSPRLLDVDGQINYEAFMSRFHWRVLNLLEALGLKDDYRLIESVDVKDSDSTYDFMSALTEQEGGGAATTMAVLGDLFFIKKLAETRPLKPSATRNKAFREFEDYDRLLRANGFTPEIINALSWKAVSLLRRDSYIRQILQEVIGPLPEHHTPKLRKEKRQWLVGVGLSLKEIESVTDEIASRIYEDPMVREALSVVKKRHESQGTDLRPAADMVLG